MGAFSNPMAEPWSLRQKLSFIFWLIFSVTSVYCAAQSLHKSTGQEKFICYILGTAIIATASLGLYQIKRSIDDGYVSRRKFRLIGGSLLFVIAWLFILAANTHFIYFKMSVDRIRLSELTAVRKNFDLAKNKTLNQIDSLSKDYSTKIDNEIDNLKTEITNQWNQGHGNKTDSILHRIEVLIGANADLMTNPPSSKDRNGLRLYADQIADKIRRIRDNNLSICNDKRKEIQDYFNENQNKEIMNTLDKVIANFETASEIEKRGVLRNSYAIFDKICKAISDIKIQLGNSNLACNVGEYKLAETPQSIDIEDIATAWKYFFSDLKNARFWWSILLAMIIDIACFAFWYFGVLSKEE